RTVSMGIVNERVHRLTDEFFWSKTQHLSTRCIYKGRPFFRGQPADAFIHGGQDEPRTLLKPGQILGLQLRLFEKPARLHLAGQDSGVQSYYGYERVKKHLLPLRDRSLESEFDDRERIVLMNDGN